MGRCLALADELSSRGWKTGMLLNGSHAKAVKEAGLRIYKPWFPKIRDATATSTVFYTYIVDGNIQIIRDGYVRPWRFWAAVGEALCIVKKFRPTVLVGDFSLLTWVVGKQADLPVVQIAQSISHPADPRIIWWEDVSPGMLSPRIEPVFNPVLEKWKMNPIHRVEELLQGDLFLIPSIPELEPLPQNVTNTHYIGALFLQKSETPAMQGNKQTETRKKVYVTIGGGAGTVGNLKYFEIINKGLGDGPWSAIVSTGRRFDPSKLPKAPSNIVYQQWVNGPAVIKNSDVVVFHGGHGTMMETVHFGIPSVILPFHSEQEGNGRRLEACSASIVISPSTMKESMRIVRNRWSYGEFAYLVQPVNTLTAEILREAVTRVLGDTRYKENAMLLRAKSRGYGGAQKGAEIIINNA